MQNFPFAFFVRRKQLSIAPTASNVNEGDTVTFNVSALGYSNGEVLFWTTESVTGTVNAADFSGGALSGSITINSQAATISRTLNNDVTTEGSESFRIHLRTDSISGPIVASSSVVTINDTSITQTATITPSTTSVNEGSSVTFTINTSGFANGSTLFWTTEQMSGVINSSDFSGGALSGSVTINSNTASLVRTLAADATTEGTESFRIQVRTGSTGGPVIATSATVTVNDTSLGWVGLFPRQNQTAVQRIAENGNVLSTGSSSPRQPPEMGAARVGSVVVVHGDAFINTNAFTLNVSGNIVSSSITASSSNSFSTCGGSEASDGNSIFFGGTRSNFAENAFRVRVSSTAILGLINTVTSITPRYGAGGALIGTNSVFVSGQNYNSITRFNSSGTLVGSQTTSGLVALFTKGAGFGSVGVFCRGGSTGPVNGFSTVNSSGTQTAISGTLGASRNNTAMARIGSVATRYGGGSASDTRITRVNTSLVLLSESGVLASFQTFGAAGLS
jgi:hypothetical protein